MLFEFHKGSNATVATKNICAVYPRAHYTFVNANGGLRGSNPVVLIFQTSLDQEDQQLSTMTCQGRKWKQISVCHTHS